MKYKKLARYFLVNLYRFPKSYILMVIVYSIRPFLKGCIHSLLYDNWELQLILLGSVEIVTIIIIILFESFLECHKSMIVLGIETLYMLGFACLNGFLLCKHKYFPQEPAFEKLIEITIAIMIISLGLRIVLELL